MPVSDMSETCGISVVVEVELLNRDHVT